MIKRARSKYLPIVTALAAVVGLAVACDRPSSVEPVSVEVADAQLDSWDQVSYGKDGGQDKQKVKKTEKHGKDKKAKKEKKKKKDRRTGEVYDVVEVEGGYEYVVTDVIDERGGSFGVPDLGHVMIVPKGAVSGPTVFELRVSDTNLFGVELTATAVGSATVNDIGSAGFRRPLDLVLSYATAEDTDLYQKIRIGYVVDSETVDLVPSAPDRKLRQVTGKIDHFSGYIIVAN